MLLWPACMAASLLVWSTQASLERPAVPATLAFHSSAAEQCDTSYVILHAKLDAPCEQHCQLLLTQTDSDSTGLRDAKAAVHWSSSLDLGLPSQLLSSNVVSFPQLLAAPKPYQLEVLCHTSSRCTATPGGWNIMHTPSELHVTPHNDTEQSLDYSTQDNAVLGCIYELSTMVTKALPSRSADDDGHKAEDSNTVITWSLRATMLVCFVVLQQTALRW